LVASQFLIDWLKTKAPFWKLEEGPEGAAWVKARASDDASAARWERPPKAADSGAADSGAVSLHERRLSWQTSVPAGEYSYLSLVLMAPRLAVDKQYMAMALIEDGVTDPLIRVARFSLAPFGTHLPYFQLDAALTR
jgi:hypothetical protein